ncbi:hypothetical protein I553_6152 [Mycobacterium xenopi 4042]|uniref:Uncharacterized protein n=1 Tax=Mycobacterium xenopi 4042 TaxID=1299334 RepID=X8BDX4_MYCXE|nr:hypothetical protein I553_6152 [Mycobacterium xenopi 4042]
MARQVNPQTRPGAALRVHPGSGGRQLQQLAMVLASRCGTHSVDDDHLPETYSELTARIQDVHRLLERLRDRFPHRPG